MSATQSKAPLPPLTRALARTDFAERWYRWCDAQHAWQTEARTTYDEDSLLTERGGYAALELDEFLQAFKAAGAAVSKGSSFPGGRHRSFTVDITRGRVACSLAIQLGRGLNSLECNLRLLVDGEVQGEPELLHVAARRILRSRDQPDPDPSSPYPRPIIGSRSQLEVVSRELVQVLGEVAEEWSAGL